MNTCFVIPESVFITGTITVVSILQEDGSSANYLTASGSGVTAAGVKYTMNEQRHVWVLGGPGQTDSSFYWYLKLTRAGEMAALEEDFYLRIYTNDPVGPGGVPNENALNTNDVVFDCR